MRDYTAIYRRGRIPLAVRELAGQAVREIAAGTLDLCAVRHPLGFLCFPLERQGPYGICVHIWSPEFDAVESTTSEIHAHSWDLISLVLFGELGNERGELRSDESTYRLYEVHSRGDQDELRPTPRLVGYRTVARDAKVHGDTYRLRAGRFHRTVAREATTIAIGRARPGQIDLSLGAVDGGCHVVRRQQCDRATSARAARMVAAQLAIRNR